MKDKTLSKYFLIVVLILTLSACLFLFKSFLIEIVIAAVMASVFYSPFLKLSKILKGRRKLAAFLMCFLLLLLVIVPISGLLVFTVKKSISAYSETLVFIEKSSENLKNGVLGKFDFIDLDNDSIKNFILDTAKSFTDWVVKSVANIIKGTTSFFISLILILLTMFFFFIDGEKMLNKIKSWSPLSDNYNNEIFNKFRSTSYVAMISTFVTAIIQGIVGAIAFIIIGMPAFYPGMLIGFFSLIPFPGSMVIYVPIGVYLILVGDIWQGLLILIWGAFIIGNTDNVIRAYILRGKGRDKINPIFVLFSLFGGLTLFGFWGLILGPLILSLVVTIFHIYELEYSASLEKQ